MMSSSQGSDKYNKVKCDLRPSYIQACVCILVTGKELVPETEKENENDSQAVAMMKDEG